MAKSTSTSETTPKPSRKTETFSISATHGTIETKKIPDYFQEYFSVKSKATSDRLVQIEADLLKLKQKTSQELKNNKQKTQNELSELRSRSDRTIETIGIFAALLSFVTFEAQIFKSDLSGLTLIGLSSLLLGALLTFVFALSNAFNPTKRDNWKEYFHPLIIIPSILVIIGGLGAYYGYKEDMKKRDMIVGLKEEISKLKVNHTASSTEMIERIAELEEKSNELISDSGRTELDVFKECILKNGLSRCL